MREIVEAATPDAVAEKAARFFVRSAARAVLDRASFFVALSGGTTPLAAYRVIATPEFATKVNWLNVHVFFGDERGVPKGHPDRNDRAAEEALLKHVPIPAFNVHPIEATEWDAAERYEADIRYVVPAGPKGVPAFDLVILGMGPDGHTASLFPGHRALEEKRRLVRALTDAPKPPRRRVTFTLPLINAARVVAFLVTGKEKKETLKHVLQGDPCLPAGCVSPAGDELYFFVDKAALSRDAPEAAGPGTA